MNREAIIRWYRENGINDIIEEKTFNHFNVSYETLPKDNSNIIQKSNVVFQQQTSIKSIRTEITMDKNEISVKSTAVAKEKIQVNANGVDKHITNINRQEFDFNYIYRNLANKYRDDNIRTLNESPITVENSIKKAREIADNSNTIDELRDAVEGFDGHLDIKKLATHTVFGEGNQKADIMVIGEAPGNNEDLEGRPFCGQSGQLLDAMFRAIDIERKDIYITNTLFWRPPGNRTPTEDEINICRPFVEKHIFLINPKIIVFMGATALKDLIETNLTITKARRQLFDYTNQYLNGKVIKTTPLFHPSYLLRQSNKKKDAWGDLLFVKKVLKDI